LESMKVKKLLGGILGVGGEDIKIGRRLKET
jgi:hypothetical protein